MEESPLNLAHSHDRRAQALLRVGKFEEAIKHHISAERILSEVSMTVFPEDVTQSLKLQREHHIREQAVIRYKQRYAEILQSYKENLKKLPYKGLSTILFNPDYKQVDSHLLVRQIFQTMVDHDSLVNDVAKRFSPNLKDKKNTPLSRSYDSLVKTGVKTPKCDKIRLEELKVSNDELKRIMVILINDMEKLDTENKTLRSTLEDLIRDHKKCLLSGHYNPPERQCMSLSTENEIAKYKNGKIVCELPALDPVKPKFHLEKQSKREKH